MPRLNTTQSEDHVHKWTARLGYSEQYCSGYYHGKLCKALKIGPAEAQRRTIEWQAYYEAIRAGDPYNDFMEMRVACKTQNPSKVKEIVERVNKRCQTSTDAFGDNVYTVTGPNVYAPTPTFPDPTGNYPYIVEAAG